jgi:hypothetical protein
MTPMTKTEQLIQRWRGPSPADPYCGNNSTAITGGGNCLDSRQPAVRAKRDLAILRCFAHVLRVAEPGLWQGGHHYGVMNVD